MKVEAKNIRNRRPLEESNASYATRSAYGSKCSSRLSCYCKFIERICARHDFSSPTVHSDICDAPLGPLISILGCQADEVLELPILHVATIHLRSASSVGQFPSSKCMVLTASAVVAAAPAAEPL